MVSEPADSGSSVTAILLSHNCADFIEEALQSVLVQDCEPMEVIVSDDASEDATFGILQRILSDYTGPHRVTLRRRETNSGSKSAHLNDVFPLTSGQIIVSFDGDDISVPFRVRAILDAFRQNAAVSAVYSNYALMDEHGHPEGTGSVPHAPAEISSGRWFARVDAYAAGATLAVRRDVFEVFGPLDPAIHEDVVLPFRASLLGEVRFIAEDLVRVRRWRGSLTADTGRFASIDRYRARMLRGIAQARRQLDGRLRDLQLAKRLQLTSRDEFEELSRIAHVSMAHAEATADLVSRSWGKRVRGLARLVRAGAYRRELAQHVFLALAPRAYLYYKRRMIGIGPGNAHSVSFNSDPSATPAPRPHTPR